MAVCVAVIAKENFPIFVKTAPAENELRFTYIVHTSLDVIEEKINSTGKSSGDIRELYLGLLYPTEDYKVYGYITNTKVKFIIITETSNVNIRDNDIRGMFRRLHTSYANMMSNPFYNTGDPVTSKMFSSTVTNMLVED